MWAYLFWLIGSLLVECLGEGWLGVSGLLLGVVGRRLDSSEGKWRGNGGDAALIVEVQVVCHFFFPSWWRGRLS